MAEIAYIGLGSNLGDRFANLLRAAGEIAVLPRTRPAAWSSLYETKPVGLEKQPAFLNAVIAVETELAPGDLLHRLLGIEQALGRERNKGERWGPRLIDCDLLICGEHLVDTPDLTLPHPRLAERRFVLVPLLEIAPDLVHPLTKRPLRESLEQLSDDDWVERVSPWPQG